MTPRSAQDTARLRSLLSKRTEVLIVGAGLIGTETAGVLAETSQRVSLVDASATPMVGLLGRTVADWTVDAHRTAGVQLHTGSTVSDVQLSDTGMLDVALSDGSMVTPQVVVVALGVVPASEWLLGSGIELGADGAVVVDGRQRVSTWPGVYFAGDMVAVPGPDGEPVRVEHWGAALSQGRSAARTALADLGLAKSPDAVPTELPSYSTYVHGTKLTILGWPQRATGELPLSGSSGDDRFAVGLHDHRDRLVAAVGVGGARAVNKIRSLVQQQAPVSELGLEPAAAR